MILIGHYDSPFVRRVAVTLHHYGMAFERQVLSVFADADAVRAVNPLGQVPVLRLDDGETLFDSAAILDHLDERAGPDRALTPADGPDRRAVLRLTAVAAGLAEKCIAYRGETVRRPADRRDPDQAARLAGQIAAALAWLDARAAGPWLHGETITQADITTAVTVTYLRHKLPDLFPADAHAALAGLTSRCERLPAFEAVPFGDH